ncbi:hypothetical protein SUGI_0808670 [Cryptomeria japonica]|nr:hypothetical protein SUGI_0808670 [Cryptomeria japonica]
MGWPLIGETFHFYSENPNTFFADKQRRYGDIFKTYFLRCPCIMIASPEACKFVLVNNSQIFKPTYPPSKERLLGQNALFFHEGEYHARVRKLVQSAIGPSSIRTVVPHIHHIALNILKTCEGRTIITFYEMKKYAFDVGIRFIFGQLDETYKKELIEYYNILEMGYNSMPLNLFGTRFNKSIKARKKLSEIMRKIMAERRANNVAHKDLLESLMAFREETGEGLSEEQITDNVIGVLFAAHHTTATVLTWFIKFLTEYPALLEAVTAEQENIQRNKENKHSLILADTEKMPLTTRVLQETMRIASVISFTFREAVEDVEYKGFIIPKGWKVMPLFRNIHHNPEWFPDPYRFDPSRFKVPPKPNTFIPFGNGIHSCPGNQLAHTEILILMHHITTKYRWEVMGTQDGIEYDPFPIPNQGFPIRVTPKAIADSGPSQSNRFRVEEGGSLAK